MANKTLLLAPRVPPSVITKRGGTGLSTRCPSPTLITTSLGLGPPHPERIALAQEPLGFRWVWFSQTIRYSCRHSHFSPLQPSLRSAFPADENAPLPRASSKRSAPRASVTTLAPLHCRRRTTRPVSCYALFHGWLLRSQPPGCLSSTTTFPTTGRSRGP
jgi:hypothetical protein